MNYTNFTFVLSGVTPPGCLQYGVFISVNNKFCPNECRHKVSQKRTSWMLVGGDRSVDSEGQPAPQTMHDGGRFVLSKPAVARSQEREGEKKKGTVSLNATETLQALDGMSREEKKELSLTSTRARATRECFIHGFVIGAALWIPA